MYVDVMSLILTDVDLDKDIVTCPVPYGGMLLLNNMIPHRR